jgi:hypothetical protein
MALDWIRLKKTGKINRESNTGLESTGSRKTWRRSVGEDIGEKGKTWRKMKR